MKAGIGLLSILVVMCIIFYVAFGMKSDTKHQGYMGNVMDHGKEVKEQATQVSGKTEDNVPVAQTIKLEPVNSGGGDLRKMKVLSITPGTPFDTVYGLKVGDEITRLGEMGVRDNNDFKLSESLMTDAYAKNWPLTIERNGEQMTLVPNSAVTKYHPDLFGKPTTPASGGTAIPTH